jgi:hypothetical protein
MARAYSLAQCRYVPEVPARASVAAARSKSNNDASGACWEQLTHGYE